MPVDYDALAKQFGGQVTMPDATPTNPLGAIADGLSPKDAAQLKMDRYQADQKRLSDLQSQIDQSLPTLNELNRFKELNKDVATGSVWESIMPNTKFMHSQKINDMNKITQGLAPFQRPAGSGSSSDTDVKLFLQGLPSTQDYGNSNVDIIKKFQRNYDYAQAKKKFLTDHLYQNGNLLNADSAWQQTPEYKAYISNQGGSGMPASKAVVKRGKYGGKTVVQYSDGSIEYAN